MPLNDLIFYLFDVSYLNDYQQMPKMKNSVLT